MLCQDASQQEVLVVADPADGSVGRSRHLRGIQVDDNMGQLRALEFDDSGRVARPDGVVDQATSFRVGPRPDADHKASRGAHQEATRIVVVLQHRRLHAVDEVDILPHVAGQIYPHALVDRHSGGLQLCRWLQLALHIVLRIGVHVSWQSRNRRVLREEGLQGSSVDHSSAPPGARQDGRVGLGFEELLESLHRRPARRPPRHLLTELPEQLGIWLAGPEGCQQLGVHLVLAAVHFVEGHAVAHGVPQARMPRALVPHAGHLVPITQQREGRRALCRCPQAQDPVEVDHVQLRELVHDDEGVHAQQGRLAVLRRLMQAERRMAGVDVDLVAVAGLHATGQLGGRQRHQDPAALGQGTVDAREDHGGLAGPGWSQAHIGLAVPRLLSQTVRLAVVLCVLDGQRSVHCSVDEPR